MNALLGQTEPDPIGQILGTGYNRFSSPLGIDGLAAQPEPGRLDLLALFSTCPGSGQLRAFINAAQTQYSTLCVWHIDNPALYDALLRYGFSPETELDQFGETLKGLRWDKS